MNKDFSWLTVFLTMGMLILPNLIIVIGGYLVITGVSKGIDGIRKLTNNDR